MSLRLLATTTIIGWTTVVMRALLITIPTVDSTYPPFVLDCLCGKGGVCHDRLPSSPPRQIVPTTGECACDISKGQYDNCVELTNHCKSYGGEDAMGQESCKNGGECVPTFGGFYCECPVGFYGHLCEIPRPENVTQLTKPMVFFFIHRTSYENKKIYLIVEQFGTNFTAKLYCDDGRRNMTLTPTIFKPFNIREFCLTEYERYPSVHDKDVCMFLPNKDVMVASITPSFDVVMNSETVKLGGTFNDIEVTYFSKGVKMYSMSYRFFSPYYGYSFICQYAIAFRGCDSFGSQHQTEYFHYTYDPISIEVIILPLSPCKAQRILKRVWRYYPNDTDIYIEEESSRYNFLSFPPLTFSPGRRVVEFMYTVSGDKTYYGVETIFISHGKCYMDIERGPVEIHFIGGDEITHPCYEPLHHHLESSNPSLDIKTIRVEWQCNGTETFCRKLTSKGGRFTYSNLACGTSYTFTAKITVQAFGMSEIVLAHQEVVTIEDIPVFRIICVYNCLAEIQPDYSIHLNVSISVITDLEPKWELYANGELVEVDRSSTESAVFHISGPLQFLNSFNRPLVEIVVTLEKTRSVLRLELAPIIFEGPCEGPKELQLFKKFSVRCENDLPPKQDYILKFGIVEYVSNWTVPIFSEEPIVFTSNMTLTNIELKQLDFDFMIIQARPYPRLGFINKTEAIVPSADKMELEFHTAFLDIDIHIQSGDYFQALTCINKAAYLMHHNRTVMGQRTVRIFLDYYKFELTKKLLLVPIPSTVSYIVKFTSAIWRLSEYASHTVLEYGNSHSRMLGLSNIFERTTVTYLRLYSSKWPDWEWFLEPEQTQYYLEAVCDLAMNILRVPKEEDDYRHLFIHTEEGADYPYVFLRASEGTNLVIKALSITLAAVHPVRQYDNAWMKRTDTYTLWCKVDKPKNLLDDIYEIPNDAVVSTSHWDQVNASKLRVSIFSMMNSIPLWCDMPPRNFVSSTVSAYFFDAETDQRIIFPSYDIIFNSLVLDEPKPGQTKLYSGEVENSPVNATEEDKDKTLVVFQFILPKVDSSQIIRFQTLNSESQKMKFYASHNKFPSYNDVFSKNITSMRGPIVVHFMGMPFKENSKFYVTVLPPSNFPPRERMYFSFEIHTLVCRTFLNYRWDSKTCRLTNFSYSDSTSSSARCSCNNLAWHAIESETTPGQRILPLAIPIRYKRTPYFYVVTAVAIWFWFFLVLFMWGLWKDKRDSIPKVMQFTESIIQPTKFNYLVAVYTGLNIGSHPNSSVGIQIFGDRDSTGPHLIRERSLKGWLTWGGEDWYLIQSHQFIGAVKFIHLWNDFTGSCSDWYCEWIIIYDLTTHHGYIFHIGQWLSRNDFPGFYYFKRADEVCVVGNEGVPELRFLEQDLLEKHRWINVFFRRKRNIYTHFERIAILMHFVFTLMGIALVMEILAEGSETSLDRIDHSITTTDMVETYALVYLDLIILFFLFEKGKDYLKKYKSSGSKAFVPYHTTNRLKYLEKKTKTQRNLWKKIQKALHNIVTSSHYIVWFSLAEFRPKCAVYMNNWLGLAWGYLIFTTAASALYMILKGLDVGRIRSINWMMVWFLGIVIDAFFLNPFMIILASGYLFYFRKRRAFDNYFIRGCYGHIQLSERDKLTYYKKLAKPCKFWRQRKEKTSPFCQTMKQPIRGQNFTKSHVVMGLIQLICVAATVYFCNIPLRGLLVENARNLISGLNDETDHALNKVRNHFTFFDYTIYSLFPVLQRTSWYNKVPITFHTRNGILPVNNTVVGGTSGYHDVLLGSIMVRQSRIKKSAIVSGYFSPWFNVSYDDLRSTNEDKDNYLRNWIPAADDDMYALENNAWIYSYDYGHTEFHSKTFRLKPFNGYIKSLSRDMRKSKITLVFLRLEEWLDNRTRHIFIGFNLYSLNTGIVTICSVGFTSPPEGIYSSTVEMIPLELDENKSQLGLAAVITVSAILSAFIMFRGIYYNSISYHYRWKMDIISLVISLSIFATAYSYMHKTYALHELVNRLSYTEFMKLHDCLIFETFVSIFLGVAILLLTLYWIRIMSPLVKAVNLKNAEKPVVNITMTVTLTLLFVFEILKTSLIVLDAPLNVSFVVNFVLKDPTVFKNTLHAANSAYFFSLWVVGQTILKTVTSAVWINCSRQSGKPTIITTYYVSWRRAERLTSVTKRNRVASIAQKLHRDMYVDASKDKKGKGTRSFLARFFEERFKSTIE